MIEMIPRAALSLACVVVAGAFGTIASNVLPVRVVEAAPNVIYATSTKPASPVAMAEQAPTGATAARAKELQSQAGFIPIRHDTKTGRLFLEVTRLNEEFLYMHGLASGLGAPTRAPFAGEAPQLDRGQINLPGGITAADVTTDEALVRFERHGSKLMLIERNLKFRALTDDKDLRRVVEESFPFSVLGAFPIVESTPDGRYVVDGTDFFLADVFNVQGRMRREGIPGVRLDRDRSYINMEHTRAFPGNSEIRAVLSFAADDPPLGLRRHVRDARSFALQQHHSFVKLPPPGYKTRRFDPRVGNRHIGFWNFAQGFDQDYRERHIARWRLEKRDPNAAISEPVKPIVYYMDRGFPEPYRTAVKRAILRWNEAFEGAGFRNALEVQDLPEGADLMDIRYSIIQFVHRSGQGGSNGRLFADPRTGEILKAMVRLDLDRSLQSYNFYAALRPAMEAAGGSPVDAEQFAMSAQEWKALHEMGHTLAFEHNWVAGTLGDGSHQYGSQMDYRPARYKVDERGELDMSEALRGKLGKWDHVLVRYAYTPFDSPEKEAAGLDAIIRQAHQDGMRWLPTQEGGLEGSVPGVHPWVDGTNMMESLQRNMAVRRVALERFDESAIRPGQPMWLLANRLTALYFHHVYPLDAATKYVGGMDYNYAIRGDGQIPTRILPAAEQREALKLVLSALTPEALAVPERITQMIPLPGYGYSRDELFIQSPTGVVFDPLTLARTLAHHVVDNLLHPERMSRVVSFHARNSENPSLDEVISRLVEATWDEPVAQENTKRALQRITQRAVLDGLFRLAVDKRAPGEVRAVVDDHLARLSERLEAGTAEDRAHRATARRDIDRYLATRVTPPLKTGVFDMIDDVGMYMTRWP